MRALLDQECAAVAGGHESECVSNATVAAIATGAILGAASGGAVGALAGAGTGSLIAQVVAPSLCKWAEEKEEEQEPVETELQNWHDNRYAAWNRNRFFQKGAGQRVYAPHEYVADGAIC